MTIVSSWPATMVIVSHSPIPGPGSPSKWPNFMAYKWGLLTNLLRGMILQVWIHFDWWFQTRQTNPPKLARKNPLIKHRELAENVT